MTNQAPLKTSWPDPEERPVVAYYRVSTKQQGRSGLGLEAQQQSVRRYLSANPGRLIAEITEVESGGKNNRPKVAEALWLCRVYDAKLVIARLDRLSRNVALIAGLLESGVDFVAADMPFANRFTIHLIAAVAEYEAKLISERTKAAFAAAKARGKKRGGPRRADFRDYFKGGSAASAIARNERAKARAHDMAPLLRELRDAGQSLYAIARQLTAMEIPTPSSRGKQWHPAVVRRHFVYAGEKLPKRRGDKTRRIAYAAQHVSSPARPLSTQQPRPERSRRDSASLGPTLLVETSATCGSRPPRPGQAPAGVSPSFLPLIVQDGRSRHPTSACDGTSRSSPRGLSGLQQWPQLEFQGAASREAALNIAGQIVTLKQSP